MSPMAASRRLHTVGTARKWGNLYSPYDDLDPGGTGGGGGTKPMWIGNCHGATNNFGAFQADLINNAPGGPTNTGVSVQRTYNTASTPPASFAASAASGDPALGVASYLSWSAPATWPTTVLTSSAQQNTIATLAGSWPSGHEGFFTIGHEPEDNGYNAADFRAMQALCYDIWTANVWDPTKVLFGPLTTADTFRTGAHLNWFPGSGTLAGVNWSKIGFVGQDGYEFWRPDPTDPNDPVFSPPSHSQYRSPSYVFGSAITFAANAPSGKPVVVGEYSAHPDSTHPAYTDGQASRPYRLQEKIDYLDSFAGSGTPVLACCLFHNSAGGHGPWWLTCYPNYTTLSDQSDRDEDTMIQLRSICADHVRYAGA